MSEAPARAILLDVDGTLVDTNYLHALAWQRAFRAVGIELPAWRLHRTVGKGGDRFVAAVAGDDIEDRCGDRVRALHGERYGELIGEARPLPGAHELIATLHEHGLATVLASSGKADEVDDYIDLLAVRELLDGWTASDDVDSSKPAPDLIEVALERTAVRPALLVGDSVWDGAAAARAGIPFVGLLCGGFGADELREAGARAVYDDPAALCADLTGAGIDV